MRHALELGTATPPVGAAATLDMLERLRAALPSLSHRMQQAAHFILEHPERSITLSAAQMALETQTSVGTVTRLCHAVGLPGIHALKSRLTAQLGTFHPATSLPTDSPGAVTFARIVSDLTRAAAVLDHDAIRQVAEVMRGSKRILIVSSGTSQPLAIEFGNWLSSAGRAVAYPTDGRTQEAVAQQLDAGDVCFAISHSGTTEVTNHPLQVAAAHGAKTVALTSYSGVPLTGLVDTAIVAGALGDGARNEDTASRMVHHAVLQVLRSLITSSSSPSDAHPSTPTRSY